MKGNFLTDEQVQSKIDFIDDIEKSITELEKQHSNKKKEIKEAKDNIANLQSRIVNEEQKIRQFENELMRIKEEHSPLLPKVEKARKDLEKDAFDKKVQGFIDGSISFYDCLKDRLQRKQEEYKATMGDYFTFIEPDKVVASILADIENHKAFGQRYVNIRAAKGRFDETTRELCTIKAKGQKPDFHTAKDQMAQLDAFLESPDVLHRWHIDKQ